ncbi:MAG: M50 family metallopeptidase [Clostridia bacterium]|nr:M50 family metallopeptidase [Clostridia bacterium]
MSEKTPVTGQTPKKKINWMQWVAIPIYLLVGGLFGVLMIQTMDSASLNGASNLQVMLIWLVLMVSIFVLFFLEIVLHEAGHLIFGLLTGYRFVSFRVGSLILIKNEQGLRVRKLRIGGTAGQCLMDPPPMVDGKMPYVLYNLGGCIVNLITAALCFGLSFAAEEGTLVHTLLIMATVIGLAFALMNGLPLPGEIANDGRNALDLGKNPEALWAFRTQMVLNRLSSEGLRLKDMPEEHFRWPEKENRSNAMIAGIAVLCTNRLLDEHRFEECAARIDEMLADDLSKLPGMYRKLLVNDRIYLYLLGGETETARQLMDKEQLQFIKVMKGQPPIHRTEYAYALLAEQDGEKAEKLLAAFGKMAKAYPHEQEIASERELIALAQERAR